MPVKVKCIVCGKEKFIKPAYVKTFKTCSYECAGVNRVALFQGSNHPRWKGGPREKTCPACNKIFKWEDMRHVPFISWSKRKFCSKPCADAGGLRRRGSDNSLWKPNSRRNTRGGKHKTWQRKVFERDNATCQHCGSKGVQLHAHHIVQVSDKPELRFELSNGLTLCHKCHWAIHSASNANAVNSVNTLPGNAEGNTEPSNQRKLVEGVTTRGRPYRRFEGKCEQCHVFISKTWSDAVGKSALFCSKSCASTWRVKTGVTTFGRYGSNAPKSAAPERDDIV
jgi:hypothetical protein